MRRLLPVWCALAVILAGCGSSDEPPVTRTAGPQLTASSPSPRPTAADSPACDLLKSKERSLLGGVPLDEVAPLPSTDKSRACRWSDDLGGSGQRIIQVQSSSSSVWAYGVPGRLERFRRTKVLSDEQRALFKKAESILAGGLKNVTNKEGCELFSLLGELNGQKKGITVGFAYLTIGTQPSASAQKCTKGIYTAVSYSEPGLIPNPLLQGILLKLLTVVHDRAIAQR